MAEIIHTSPITIERDRGPIRIAQIEGFSEPDSNRITEPTMCQLLGMNCNVATDICFSILSVALAYGVAVHPRALCRSSQRSSQSSMPTERRNKRSEMPSRFLISAGTAACDILQQWVKMVSTPPKLGAMIGRRIFSSKGVTCVLSFNSKLNTAPGPSACARWSDRCGKSLSSG